MTEYKYVKCPKCSQQLRIPKDVGGIVMACPSCGQKMHSDFKIGGVGRAKTVKKKNILYQMFELPGRLLDILFKK